jgi:hypothetical protein
VRSTQDAVLIALDDQARENHLTVVSRTSGTTTWASPSGTAAAVARGLRGRRGYPLLALKELRATVVESDSQLVRVRLEGRLRFPWRVLPGSGKALCVLGVAGGAYLAVGVDGFGHTDWALDMTGAMAAFAGASIGVSVYRRSVADIELALAGMLDRLG